MREPYSRIEQVPPRWRAYRHGRLTLQQINQLVDQAEADAEPFARAFGRLREELEQSHEIVDGFWVAKGGQS